MRSSTRTRQVDDVRAAEQDAGDDRQRDEDPVVQVLVGELAAAGLEADHLELVAAHAHRLADRVLAGEEPRGRVQAEHHHLAPEAVVGAR